MGLIERRKRLVAGWVLVVAIVVSWAGRAIAQGPVTARPEIVQTEIWYGTKRITTSGDKQISPPRNIPAQSPASDASQLPIGAPYPFGTADQSLQFLPRPWESPEHVSQSLYSQETWSDAPLAEFVTGDGFLKAALAGHADTAPDEYPCAPQDAFSREFLSAAPPHAISVPAERASTGAIKPQDKGVAQAALWQPVDAVNGQDTHTEDGRKSRQAGLHRSGREPVAREASRQDVATVPDEPGPWQRMASAVAIFFAGALLCPLVLGLALTRYLRRTGRHLFRIEIVGGNSGTASLAWPSDSAPQPEFPALPARESGRRGAASLDPPPLELPVEETFVARRRREQEQQSEHEQQILQELFEDNLALRRQLEE